MIRMSALRNYPVIHQNQQIGLLQSISLDPVQIRVHALVVSCGLRGKRIIPAASVKTISQGFILAEDVQKYDRTLESRSSAFVRDTTGVLVGKVTDYAIDEKRLTIQALEMTTGYWPGKNSVRIWIFEYTLSSERENELTVPACVGCGLIDQKEGMDACACQP